MDRGYTGWLDDLASGDSLAGVPNGHTERVEYVPVIRDQCPCGFPGTVAECDAADQDRVIADLDGVEPGPGCCTQCGGTGAEVPWGQRSLLCWDCTDVQLDLMALACQSESGLPVEVKLA